MGKSMFMIALHINGFTLYKGYITVNYLYLEIHLLIIYAISQGKVLSLQFEAKDKFLVCTSSDSCIRLIDFKKKAIEKSFDRIIGKYSSSLLIYLDHHHK